MLEMETAYWTGFDIDDLAWHAQALNGGGSQVHHRLSLEGGAMALFVSGADRPGLFADLAGTLAHNGANIIAAQVYTSREGGIIDVFMLHDIQDKPFGKDDPARLQRLEAALMKVLAGQPGDMTVRERTGRRQAAFLVQPSVQIRDDLSADYTVIDIAGRDRPALLYDVATCLAAAKVSIHSAHVGSYGERMFDAFYVKTEDGRKLEEFAALKESLREQLLDVLGRHEPEAPHTPARKLKRSRAVDSF
jgi:[protein-PII] uridylyltransferase